MAGTLTLDTLKTSSGVLATQNGMTGIAKAWVNYNGVTQTINGSFNVSSITYNGVGDYTINFATAMPNAYYSVSGICQRDQTGGGAGNGFEGFVCLPKGLATSSVTTTTFCRVRVLARDGTYDYGNIVCVTVNGS
jgi:hypothetical protein